MLKKILFSSILGIVVVSTSYAQTPTPSEGETTQATEEKVEKVNIGVVASTKSAAQAKDFNVQSTDAPGDVQSVITASISRVKRNECKVILMNNGKSGYSVSFSVEGRDDRGNKALNRFYSATVASGSKVEKSVSGCREGLDLAVNLKSAKALSK